MSEQGVALSTEQRELLERVAEHLEADIRENSVRLHPSWGPVRRQWRADSKALRHLASAASKRSAFRREFEAVVPGESEHSRASQPASAEPILPHEGQIIEGTAFERERRAKYLGGMEQPVSVQPTGGAEAPLTETRQEMADRIWSRMCGRCEKWSHYGGGRGWCSDHKRGTMSGHSCKDCHPKAPTPENANPKPAPPASAPEGECPHYGSGFSCALVRTRDRGCSYYGKIEQREVCAFRALAADRAKLELECAEWRADRLGLVKQIEGLVAENERLRGSLQEYHGKWMDASRSSSGLVAENAILRERAEQAEERVRIAEANAQERNRCAQTMDGLYREENKRAEQAEAEGSEA